MLATHIPEYRREAELLSTETLHACKLSTRRPR